VYHQSLDSYKEPQNMRSIAVVSIQGVLNENHCAETPDKVRETLDIKRRNGEFIGAFAPYGYRKHPDDKNALVIDILLAVDPLEAFFPYW
jgi:site-specific DNA recombinase